MIVAMHIMSESCDHYVELYVNKSIEEIKQELYNGMEWYCPVADYGFKIDENTSTESERLEFQEMVSKWHDDSWNHDEEDY